MWNLADHHRMPLDVIDDLPIRQAVDLMAADKISLMSPTPGWRAVELHRTDGQSTSSPR
jgi:hypothetical protein